MNMDPQMDGLILFVAFVHFFKIAGSFGKQSLGPETKVHHEGRRGYFTTERAEFRDGFAENTSQDVWRVLHEQHVKRVRRP